MMPPTRPISAKACLRVPLERNCRIQKSTHHPPSAPTAAGGPLPHRSAGERRLVLVVDERRQLSRRPGRRPEVALRELAPEFGERLALLVGLDPFGDRLHPEGMG